MPTCLIVVAGDAATPRSSRLSVQGRGNGFPYDDVMQVAEPNQAPHPGGTSGMSNQPIITENRQDGYADSQGESHGKAQGGSYILTNVTRKRACFHPSIRAMIH